MTGGWLAEAAAVLRKDILSETRSRAAVSTLLLFAIVTLLLVAFTVRTTGPGLTQGLIDNFRQVLLENPEAEVYRTIPGTGPARAGLLSALLWTILFFSAMAALPRTFVKEEESGTATALRLMVRPTAVFAGKLGFNGLLLLSEVAVVTPLFLVLFTPGVENWPAFLGQLVLGALALAGSATLLGAIVARTGGKSHLMLPLAFPVLLPVLVNAINGTAAALSGQGGNHLLVQVSYLVAVVTLSLMLFDRVWSDA